MSRASQPATRLATATATPGLRPVTLPQLPSAWSKVTALKAQLVGLESEIAAYAKVEKKLETITDEPTWQAMIPLGPLAYFPGQLIHTNDITQTIQPSSPVSTSPRPTSRDTKETAGAWKVLKSAKQAREGALQSRHELEKEVRELEEEIARRETEIRSRGNAGLEEGWKLNERGEVLNEEGLPVFDIHEELGPEPEVVEEIKSSPAVAKPKPAPQLRYLIKKNGKQVVRPLNVPFAPTPALESTTIPPSAPSPGLSLDTQAILDALEREDAAAEAEATATSQDEEATLEVPAAAPVVPATSPTPIEQPAVLAAKATAPSTPAAPKPKPSAKDSLPGFSSGFLGRPKSTKPKVSTPSAKLSAPPTASTSSASASITSQEPVIHQPLHHTLPPSKSIYRPTPPPSAPSSRPNSPRPDRRVAFDVPTDPETKSPKAKRAAILLPPPPPPHDDFPQEFSSDPPPPPPTPKVPFQRPIKETVVERPVRPPTAPKPRVVPTAAKKEDGQPILTLGRAPKPAVAATLIQPSSGPPQPRGSTSVATPIAAPIHTLSFSQIPAVAPKDGQASIHEFVPEDIEYDDDLDEERPSLTSDGESDSSGFYGNSDDEDDEEIDIDGALHAREVALEYHRQRMNLGAGAGTGPLGGDLEPEAYDSWNQPNVPIEATLQGRVPGVGRSSRFRTGRLESAQMIIPSLLAQHVREDGQDSEDEDDGLTPEERENIRKSLEVLAGRTDDGGPATLDGRRIVPALSGSISQLLGTTSEEKVVKGKAPPVVGAAGVPIAVPANPAMEVREEPQAPSERPKKMSRFKARQLGLEPEV